MNNYEMGIKRNEKNCKNRKIIKAIDNNIVNSLNIKGDSSIYNIFQFLS